MQKPSSKEEERLTAIYLTSAEKPSDQRQKKGERFLENGKCYGENEAHSLKKATNWKHCTMRPGLYKPVRNKKGMCEVGGDGEALCPSAREWV
jgi:hypothetical protein